MTRSQFEAELKRMADHYDMPPCPDAMKESAWEDCKNMTLAQFRERLREWFEQMETKNKLMFKYLEECGSKEDAQVFVDEVNEYKKEIAILLKRLVSSKSGHAVLEELAGHFECEIDIEELSEQASSVVVRNNDDDKCPDAITPDILKILKGESPDK